MLNDTCVRISGVSVCLMGTKDDDTNLLCFRARAMGAGVNGEERVV